MRKTLGFTFLLFLLSGFAYADGVPVDPNMVVNDPLCDSGSPCAPIVSSQVLFTFSASSSGGSTTPITTFEVNPSGPTFTTLDIETPGIFDSTNLVHCSSNQFSCTPSFIGGVTNLHFFIDTTICPNCVGFLPGFTFTLNLDDPGAPAGTGSWGAGREFGGEANLGTTPTTPFFTPEPSSVVMLVSGVAALATRRKLFKRS